MDKSPEAFRTISEVADWLGTPTHVLRFWESRFTQVKPVKRAGGRRYYRPADMALLGGIKKLLHEDGLTIRGVQKMLREHGVKHVASMSPRFDGMEEVEAPFEAVVDELPHSAEVVQLEVARAAPPEAEVEVAPERTPEPEPTPAPAPVQAPVAVEPATPDPLPLSPAPAEARALEPAPEPTPEPTPEPEPEPTPEPTPAVAAQDPAAATESAPDADGDAPDSAAPALPAWTGLSVVEALEKGARPDPAALRPIYAQLSALRERMKSDRPRGAGE